MNKSIYKPPKAYKNIEFLISPQARAIRILSEFLEPRARFLKENIKDTIVVFGSSRILSKKIAKKRLQGLTNSHKNKKVISSKIIQQLEDAKNDLLMSSYYEDATKLTYMLTRWSKQSDINRHYVICSGGGPGIMEAANKGAIKAGGKSIGLNISLPFEQTPNLFISKNLNFEFHYFFMRKFWFVYLAKALIMFPGGFGTMDELMEVLTLVQTKKVTKHLPIVLYGSKYWNEIVNFNALVKYRVISKNDLNLFTFADSPKEAFQYLTKALNRNSA